MRSKNSFKKLLEDVKEKEQVDKTNPFGEREDFTSEAQVDLSIEDDVDISIENKNNDALIDKDYLEALISQRDRVVHYRIENIYSDEERKNYKNRMKIKRDPPTLIIRDDKDNESIFYLTENLTDELSETLNEVKRAYLGFSGPKDIETPNKVRDKIAYYLRNNYIKIGVGILLIIFMFSFKI